jgi:hypothetical protein
VVLAHGSGIDELAMFVVPVVVAVIVLRRAEQRARERIEGDRDPVHHPHPDDTPAP